MSAKVIKQTTIDNILHDCQRVIEYFVSPSRQNHKEAWYLSPFNKSDSNPSMKLDKTKGMWFDHSMQFGGVAITFVEKYENRPWREAVIRSAEILGIEVEYEDDTVHNDPIYQTNYRYMTWSHDRLMNNMEALGYLLDRGISIETIEKFKIGVHDTNLPIKARSLLEDADLVKGNNWTFQDRITFPYFSRSKRVIGFAGRVYNGGDNPYKKDAKYINTKDTRIFQKRTFLYGIGTNTNNIRKQACLVEGPIDVLTSDSSGYPHCLAYQSSGITQEQARMISNLSNDIIFYPDPDIINKKPENLVKSYKNLLGYGVIPQTLIAEDDFAAMCEMIDNIPSWMSDSCVDFIEMITMVKNNEEVAKQMVSILGMIPDVVRRKNMAEKVATLLHCKEEEVFRMFSQESFNQHPDKALVKTPERKLIHYIIQNPSQLREILQQIPIRPLSNTVHELILQNLESHPPEYLASLTETCELYAEMMTAPTMIQSEGLDKLIQRVNIDIIEIRILENMNKKEDGWMKEVGQLQMFKKQIQKQA